MTFSIIIPVYQVEEYLEQCLESVINQNFKDFEIILIDDGSTDNSGKICDDYAEEYSNIHVIHQQNCGLSSARNRGVEKAGGDYLVFIDSDDYIGPKGFEQMDIELKKSSFPDLLITQYITFISTGVTGYHNKFLQEYEISKIHKEDVIRLLLDHSECLWPAWGYVAKKEFIEKHNLRFPEGLLHEDIQWTTRILIHAETFSALNLFWYYYRMDNKTSITNNMAIRNYMDIIKITTSNIHYIHCNCNNKKIRKSLNRRLSKEFIDILLLRFNEFGENDRRKTIEMFKRNKKYFKKNNRFKYQLFFAFSSLFGLDLGLKIYRRLLRLKNKSILIEDRVL